MNNALGLLLFCFAVLGISSADEPPERVKAFVGLSVILPCKQHIPPNTEVPTVEWSKAGLKPEFVYVYRNYEMYADKHKDFEFRTQLFMTDLHHGNFSMRLSEVRESDAGVYKCKTIWGRGKKDEKMVELVVEHVPTPKLSVLSSGSDAVNLSCEVRACFQTAPQIKFSDGDGILLTADKGEQIMEEESECYRLEQRVTAPTSAKSVVCRVEFAEISQSRDTHIFIPEATKESCTFHMVLAGIAVLFFSLVVVGAGFLVHKCCRKSGEKKKMVRQSSDDTTTSTESENRHLLLPHVSVNIPEIVPEQLLTVSAEPDVVSSASSSTVSKADSVRESVFVTFPDGVDSDAATCQMDPALESVKFQNKGEEKGPNLVRQDAISVHSVVTSLPDVTSQFGKSKGKTPARRCRSVSDSCSMPRTDCTSLWRRHSMSVLSGVKFEQLPEDPEQESDHTDSGRQE